MFDLLLTNAVVATMDGETPYGLVRDGAIGVAGGKVAFVGRAAEVPPNMQGGGVGRVWDLKGKVVTPGLVDPHTHIVYGEEGLVDFEVLSEGGQRWDLEARGGGVGGMVKRTRSMSEQALYDASRARMSRLIANGSRCRLRVACRSRPRVRLSSRPRSKLGPNVRRPVRTSVIASEDQ